MRKWKCCDCGTITKDKDLLSAKNPFNNKEVIKGCPECKEVGFFTVICEFEGCEDYGNTGTPIKGGYTWTCVKHQPEDK